MKRNFCALTGVALCLLIMAFTGTSRAQKALPDFPYLSHLSDYHLRTSDDREFDEYSFFDGNQMVTVEGRKYAKRYDINKGATLASPLQITRNYANAVQAAGGQVLYDGKPDARVPRNRSGDRLASLKFVKDGKEIWVEIIVRGNGNPYWLTAIEKAEMKQDVAKTEPQPEAPKPEPPKEEPQPEAKRDLAKEIKTQGFATIYVNFDVDKSTIKPESQPILDQVAQMLKDNSDLNLTIAGHTDSSGTWAHNKALSENRAQAVLQALVARGIAADRLASVGYGQDKPVADNATEAGKAKNRRVELIKR